MVKEGISFTCAPFEAEWQCTMFKKSNFLDSVIASDGDCLCLGAEHFYFKISFFSGMFKTHQNREEIMYKVENPFL